MDPIKHTRPGSSGKTQVLSPSTCCLKKETFSSIIYILVHTNIGNFFCPSKTSVSSLWEMGAYRLLIRRVF